PPILMSAAYAWFGYLATPRNFHQELFAETHANSAESGRHGSNSLAFGGLRRQAVVGKSLLAPRPAHPSPGPSPTRGGEGGEVDVAQATATFEKDWAFKNAEAYFYLVGATLVLIAFAIVLGVHVA